MRTRKTLYVVMTVVMAVVLVGVSSGKVLAADKAEQQADIRAMADKVLTKLYAQQPQAKGLVEGAVGYAVFSDRGFKVMFLGGGRGKGLAVDNATKEETFMDMIELQPGLGLGVEKFDLVLVFETAAAFEDFLGEGWAFATTSIAEAKKGTKGGALDHWTVISDGVQLIQINEAGLIVGISITGAKYSKDKDLN
jgi:lipid-binding SYLF domain-containing protein